MSCNSIVQYYLNVDLSGQDIFHLTRKSPVLYSDLAKYKNVRELLGKEGYVVILYQTSSKTSGHWVSLYLRNDGVLCFADSYGLRFDTEQQYAAFDKPLPRYLTQLIESSGMQIDYNKTDFQNKSSRISTCGRYATFFCLFGPRMNFQKIKTFLTSNSSDFLKPDNIVTLLTLWSLDEIPSYFQQMRPNNI